MRTRRVRTREGVLERNETGKGNFFFSTRNEALLHTDEKQRERQRSDRAYPAPLQLRVAVVVPVNGSHLIKNYLITFLALISGVGSLFSVSLSFSIKCWPLPSSGRFSLALSLFHLLFRSFSFTALFFFLFSLDLRFSLHEYDLYTYTYRTDIHIYTQAVANVSQLLRLNFNSTYPTCL